MLVLDDGGETESVALDGGRMCIVPQGTWHRLLVKKSGRLLFATPRPSTEHPSVREHTAMQQAAHVD